MKFGKLVVWVVLVFLVCSIAIAKNKQWKEDLNGDGVKEIIEWKEESGGNNYWGHLKILRQGKIVFSSDNFCVTGDREGFWLLDLDKSVKGKELIVYRDDKNTAKYLPDRFRFEVYHWKSGKYIFNRSIHTEGKYKTGKDAKKEMDAILAGKRTVKCYIVIAGSYKTKKEAEKNKERFQQHFGDLWGYDIDSSNHYRGCRSGYWILVTGYREKKGAAEWVEETKKRCNVCAYIKFVTKTCDCDIFHSGSY